MATYVFRTPIRNPQGPRDLAVANPKTDFDQGERTSRLSQLTHSHGGYPVAVYIHNGVVGEKAVPTQEEMQAWDITYMGGRENVITEAEAEMLAVVDSTDSRKVVGFLTENFARRRYVEEIDKATRGVLGALS